jgi:hypothetical protein
MSKDYTGFPISNFRTGFNEALEPWLIPRDAFQVLQNCHLYRGVVEKIPGYNVFTQMSYRKIIQLSGTINGVNNTFTGTLSPLPTTNNIIVQGTINGAATSIESFTDNGTGTLVGTNGGSGTIDYSTGAVSVTFGASAPTSLNFGGVQYNAVILSYDYAAGVSYPDATIMGIKQYINSSGTPNIIVFNTRRAGQVVVLVDDMATLQELDYGVSELPHETQTLNITTGFNNTPGPFTGTVTGPIVPGSVTFKVFDSASSTATLLDTITDNGCGLLTGSTLDPAARSLINYATGEWRMVFLGNQPATNTMNFSGCIYGDIFTGDFSNFFSTVNFQAKMFLTNSIDPPMYYDGMCIKYLTTNLTDKPNTIAPYDLDKVLHVTVQRERLLLISVLANGVPLLNTIYWSAASNPLNFSNTDPTSGNLQAPTSESIKTFSIINTDLIVRFSNSERVFRYTADAFSPFRWDSTNVIWRCDAPYSAINYDSWFSSVGRPAIVGSDGVNVKRVDEIIPDFTLNLRIDEQQPVLSIDQTSIGQCYGERFDDFKEGWLCYKAYHADQPNDGTVQPSDSVLAFSYLDETYAVYTFPFSCLGFGRISSEDTWGNAFTAWEESEFAWNSFTQTSNALIDLAGDRNGIVYLLGNGSSITDEDGNSIPCLFEVITKDFNPFVESGELARFGYVDFLVSSNTDTKFRVQFYKDNQLDADFDTYYQETTLTLTPTQGQSKVWKRIYTGAVGRSHTMRIYQNADDFTEETANQPIRIHAIVPYFKAAGRIFN